MKNHRQRKGRPPLVDGKRTKKIDARFTGEEYKLILALESTLGMSKSEIIRARLLHNAANTVINAKELIACLDSVGGEIGRSGNNINQLARYANILIKKNALSPLVVEQFNLLFAQYLANQRSLDTALRNIMRALRN